MNVQPISLLNEGRGNSIMQTPFGSCTCFSLDTFGNDTYLVVEPDGSVYPECSCSSAEHMRLGKIGEDSLVELIRRKDLFAERIMAAILSDKRHCNWGTIEVCTLCKQIVAEKGLGLK
jgi:radical SAM protein with 4Fe4S-binding SPASM domain